MVNPPCITPLMSHHLPSMPQLVNTHHKLWDTLLSSLMDTHHNNQWAIHPSSNSISSHQLAIHNSHQLVIHNSSLRDTHLSSNLWDIHHSSNLWDTHHSSNNTNSQLWAINNSSLWDILHSNHPWAIHSNSKWVIHNSRLVTHLSNSRWAIHLSNSRWATLLSNRYLASLRWALVSLL